MDFFPENMGDVSIMMLSGIGKPKAGKVGILLILVGLSEKHNMYCVGQFRKWNAQETDT